LMYRAFWRRVLSNRASGPTSICKFRCAVYHCCLRFDRNGGLCFWIPDYSGYSLARPIRN
jgi:hypothetical protein